MCKNLFEIVQTNALDYYWENIYWGIYCMRMS